MKDLLIDLRNLWFVLGCVFLMVHLVIPESPGKLTILRTFAIVFLVLSILANFLFFLT